MFPKDKGGQCVGLTTLPPSCADCLKIWETQPPGTSGPVQACNGTPLPLSLLNKMWHITYFLLLTIVGMEGGKVCK